MNGQNVVTEDQLPEAQNLENYAQLTGATFTGHIYIQSVITGATGSFTSLLSNGDHVLTTSSFISPSFTGTPTAPTPDPSNNSTQIATTNFVTTAISNLVGTAPDVLNTLQEISTSLNNDPSFNYTIVKQLALKAPLDNPIFTGTVLGPTGTFNYLSINNGITGPTASFNSLIINSESSSNNMNFLPQSALGSFNPATDANNQVIVASGTKNTEVLQITTWSDTNSSVKVKPTSVVMGAGGATNTPTSSIECNGTNVVVNPNIKYPDNTIQNSAFTGAGNLAGSYTDANITIDANGKITAISNGSVLFVPKFHNFANYQTVSSGYSQGPYIYWSSGWGALDYAIIRIRAQINWGITGGEYNNYASTSGELIIRPYYSPSGTFGDLTASPSLLWATNTGTVFGATKKLLYYSGVVNTGTQSYFFIYGSGGTLGGGSSSGYIQLMCDSPGTAGGWQYTCSVEYILHSTSGASITFSNGNGTNKSLP